MVWINFNPQSGHEQTGRRPALVLSPSSYNSKVGLAILCPITSKIKGYPIGYYILDRWRKRGEACPHIDTITFKIETLRFAAEIMPEGYVYMGTDYPYDMADVDPIGSVEAAFGDAGEREQIFCKNILKTL